MIATTLVAGGEGFLEVDAGILVLDIFEHGIHLARDLVEFQTSRFGVQGGFESHAIELFVVGEISSRL